MLEAFIRVTNYCQSKDKDRATRNHAYCIYMEALKQATEKQQDQSTLELMTEVLLTEEALEGYISRAEVFIESTTQAIVRPYERREKVESFLFSVLVSIVGNFLYTVLLIILFIVAKDQIRTWLSTLT